MFMQKRFRLACGVLACLLLAAGCSSGAPDPVTDGPDTETETETETETSDEATPIRFLIPFPSALTFYSLHVAQHMGYLEDEGIDLTIEAADGTSSVIQQIAAGNADSGYVTAAGQMGAAIEGHELVAFYVLATRLPFGLLTSSATGISDLQDLEGRTIGVSSPTGGENYYVQAMLNAEGINASITPVGRAGEAELAFERGQIDAYATATTDLVGIARLFAEDGLETVHLGFGALDGHFGGSMATVAETLQARPAAFAGLARAFTKGTLWGFENPEGVLAIIQQAFPEQVVDCDAARSLLEAHFESRRPTSSMNGQFGINVAETWSSVSTLLFEQGALSEDVDTSTLFTNDLIADINDFDADAVRADAAAFAETPSC